jgi:hypothetical protein
MSTRFRADNIGSLLRPVELLRARADYLEQRIDLKQLRQSEDRAILTARNAASLRRRPGTLFLGMISAASSNWWLR